MQQAAQYPSNDRLHMAPAKANTVIARVAAPRNSIRTTLSPFGTRTALRPTYAGTIGVGCPLIQARQRESYASA